MLTLLLYTHFGSHTGYLYLWKGCFDKPSGSLRKVAIVEHLRYNYVWLINIMGIFRKNLEMKTRSCVRFAMAAAIVLMLTVFSGCIKRSSEPLVEEKDFWPVTEKITVSNPIGMVSVNGNGARLFNPHVRVSKSVQTYSLLGLANPDKYLNMVEVYRGVSNGELSVSVSVKQLPFVERLFVKVSPKVDLALETPVALDTTAEVNVGTVELNNLVGDVTATVDVGAMAITSNLGVFGSQSFEINIGSLDISLPADMPIRYDLETSIGSIESAGFNADVERHLLGARTTGVAGTTVTPSSIKGRVNIGNINFQGE